MAGMVDKSQMTGVEAQLAVLSSQLDSTKQQLNWTTAELGKEKATVESMLRHKEVKLVQRPAFGSAAVWVPWCHASLWPRRSKQVYTWFR